MGYDEVIFKHAVDKQYECPVCLFPLKSPVQTSCGHLFCQSCIAPILKHKEPRCPLDKEPLDVSQIFPDNYTNKQLLGMIVLCLNKEQDCEWEGELKSLESHLDECPCALVSCPAECTEKVRRKDLKEHVESFCKNRKSTCEYCNAEILADQMEVHKDTACKERFVECDRCKEEMPKYQVSKHLETDCPNSEIDCPLNCKKKAQLLRKDLLDHLGEPASVGGHFSTLFAMFGDLKKQVERKDRWTEMEQKIQRSEALIQIYEAEKIQQDQRIKKLEGRVESVLMLNSELENKTHSLEVAVQLLQSKVDLTSSLQVAIPSSVVRDGSSVVRDSVPDMKTTTSTSTTTSTKSRSSSSEGTTSSYPQLIATKAESVTSSTSSDQIRQDMRVCLNKVYDFDKQLSNVDRMQAARDIAMAEVDLRIQVLETCSYDGVLVWRVPHYRRRRQDAISGRTPSLYSPPFYTSRHGYKMCGRVYLNGDGMGKGTHLSLFFVVMKGQFDALLPWPFRQRVTLMVLDQSQARRHVTDTFRPDPQSSSFQRPVNDMNIASGCPLFVALESVESRGYVKDDALYICIKVDTTSLKDP